MLDMIHVQYLRKKTFEFNIFTLFGIVLPYIELFLSIEKLVSST